MRLPKNGPIIQEVGYVLPALPRGAKPPGQKKQQKRHNGVNGNGASAQASGRAAETARRKAAILEYIDQYLAENYIAPTTRQIADQFDLSTSIVYGYIQQLEKAGEITRTKNTARALLRPWFKSAVDAAGRPTAAQS